MAELVADAFLSVLFEKLFEQLASPEFRKSSTGYQLKQLESKLKMARLLLDDAEDRQLSDPSVKEWLEELKHIVFLADDVAEEIDNKATLKSRRKSVIRVVKSIYQALIGSTVQGVIGMISTDLDVLLARASVLELKHRDNAAGVRGTSPILTTPLREEHHVFGRNNDKDEILELILSGAAFESHQIGVVPIVGMGGLGKTTLARLVYDDGRVKEPEFELRAWVTVSTEFDAFRIIKAILQQIQPGGSDAEEPTQLQQKLKDALRGKKFLFVLDDVWDENYNNWDLLMSSFSSEVSVGSRIVVTTRSSKVGSVVKTGPLYELREVSDDDCWSIFVHHAFSIGNSNVDPRLNEIGRRIVKKCKGLPLAVKAIGGLLRSERNIMKWENILNSHVWEWGENKQGNGVLPSLWLSYRCLPSSLKQCFAYSSVFPQDHEFHKKEMVLLWMAEGFLQHGNQEMEQVGEQYFDDLVSRSLFQRSSKEESTFSMHDLIHDLAAFVSGEFCVRDVMKGEKLKSVTTRTRHLSHIYESFNNTKLWTGVSKAKHLRSFLGQKEYAYIPNGEFVRKLITKQRRLRVLSLHTISPISDSFFDLKHLRYLNLSNCIFKEVPSSVCTLFNLQTLLLSYCRKLTQLPVDIEKLLKLRHLDITGTRLTHMPPKMGNLKELRELTDFVLGDSDGSACSHIKEIGELRHLGGKLCISRLQNVGTSEDAGKDILSHKENLKELVLEWGYATETISEANKEVLDALKPPTNLEKLVIWNYSASSFPMWVCELSFWKLESVQLRGVFCDSLPPLGQLPSLLKIVIECFDAVEKIGFEFYGTNSSVTPFRCLESLEFSYMKRLKEWVFVDKAFPCLKNLKLNECPVLQVSSIDCKTIEVFDISGNSLECFPLDKYPTLRKLSLDWCLNLKSLTNNANSESLTSMKLYNCPEMESFPEEGLPKSLIHLCIERCAKVMARQSRWGLQNLPSLMSLSIRDSACDSASSSELFAQVLLPNSLASLELRNLGGFKSLNGSAFQQAKSLSQLYIRGCNELESLPENDLPSCLSILNIDECRILERKYHKSKGESYQHISHIPDLHIYGITTFEMNL